MSAGAQTASAAKGTITARMDVPWNGLLRNGAHPVFAGLEIFAPRNPLF